MTIDREVAQAVETVARWDDERMLRRSPFHLQACGGCGAPSYKQPCNVCGFYPMGPEKGTWAPKEATLADFERAIERSGPGGKGGTLLTWFVRDRLAYLKDPGAAESVAREVASIPMPSAGDVWKVVVEGRKVVHRQDSGQPASYDGWSGLEGLVAVATWEGRGDPGAFSKLAYLVRELWIPALRAGDATAMREAIEAVVAIVPEVRARCGMPGNVASAQSSLERALERLPTDAPRP